MSGGVCLNCGREMEYDWAPCPHCGWKAPEPWEEPQGEEGDGPTSDGTLLSKNRPWIRGTIWVLLAAGLAGGLAWLFRSC